MSSRLGYLLIAAEIGLFQFLPQAHAAKEELRHCLDLAQIKDVQLAGTLRSSLNPPAALPQSGRSDPEASAQLGTEEVGERSGVSDPFNENELMTIAAEQSRLRTLLKELGYLDAQIELSRYSAKWYIEGGLYCSPSDESSRFRRLIVFRPDPGPLYQIGWIRVAGVKGSDPVAIQSDLRWILARSVGRPVQGEILLQAEDEIRWHARSASFPRAKILEREIILASNNTVGVQIVVDPGPRMRFGVVEWRGAAETDRQVLNGYVPFTHGDPFTPEKIETLRRSLEGTELFRNIRIELIDSTEAADEINVTVRLQSKPPNPERLAQDGGVGRTMMMIALVAVGSRQVLLASGRDSRSRRFIFLNFFSIILLLISAVFAIVRLLDLMN